ncbi:MAG: hypothetical protein ACK4K7_09670 [Allosphingosinicella sp.]|uniref:hypothetical protein n=1 Tax=Allosphingosinicella sp. TaxID=2823234 RepID=UPI003944DCCD
MRPIGYGFGLSPRQRGGGFSPAALFAGGAQGAWYDPADAASMFQDSGGTVAAAVGSPVGMIRDKSGRGNHAVQATASARPILRQDGGGRLYLEFDGADDRLVAAFALPQPFDRVSAVRQAAWTSGRVLFGNNGSDAGVLYQTSAAPRLYLFSGAATPFSAGLPVDVNGVVTERFDGAASRIAVNKAAFAVGNSGSAGVAGVSLGGRSAGTSGAQMRLYGMLMIGRALSDAETGRLRAFMAARAGVAL